MADHEEEEHEPRRITAALRVESVSEGGSGGGGAEPYGVSGQNGTTTTTTTTVLERENSRVSGLTITLHGVGVDIVKGGGLWKRLFFWKRRGVPDPEEGAKSILHDVTAVVRGGEMYGLMGPSGAGKTTLLDVISHRLKHPAKMRGSVLYDNHHPTMAEVRRDASYVEQSDDVLSCMGHFTVFELVLFAAMCKLPHDKWTKEEKIQRVNQVLKQMSLDSAANTVVGNPGVGLRGVSGGERKRVAISMGLLYNPRAIFLDEPTTGLDSAMASEVMHIVKQRLQRRGCTIVVTIHQPSPVIFSLLDSVILLKGGRVVYLGPGGNDGPCAYFKSLGYPYRTGYNIAEFLLETVTDKAAVCDFAQKFQDSDLCAGQMAQAELAWRQWEVQHSSGSSTSERWGAAKPEVGMRRERMRFANTRAGEIWVLLRYRVAPKLRMGWFVMSKLALPILVGGVYATFFNNLPRNFFGTFATAGLLFVTVALAGFLAIAPLEDFRGEWALILRQRQDGYYRSSSYVVEKMVQELPYGILGSLGFAVITYFSIGLKMTPYAFFFYTLCSFVVNIVSTACSFGVASNIHVEFLPQVVIHVWTTLNIMVTGLFLPKCQIPVWWSWLYWISYQQWTWSALMLNQYGEQSGVEQSVIDGTCEASFGDGAKCSGGFGSVMNLLPTLLQATGEFTSSSNGTSNKCVQMNDFALNMFFLGEGAHSNMWLCLLYASLSLPVFLCLFYLGVWRSTRRSGL